MEAIGRMWLGVAVATAVALGLAGPAVAATGSPIRYIEHAIATGSLGSRQFTNASVTMSFSGNTSTVTNPQAGVWTNPTGTTTVDVQGVGSATVTGATDVRVVQNPYVGGGTFQIEHGGAFFSVQNSAFLSYDLNKAFGPITGPGAFRWGFSTTAGGFKLTSVGTVTFVARLGSGG